CPQQRSGTTLTLARASPKIRHAVDDERKTRESRLHARGDSPLAREDEEQSWRTLRCRHRSQGYDRRAGMESSHLRERSDRARGDRRHSRRLQAPRALPSRRMRSLYELRTVPDVPWGDLLGAHRPRVLREYAQGRREDRLRRCRSEEHTSELQSRENLV